MGTPKIEGLAHVSLFINDIQRSYEFYTGVLGFELVLDTRNPSPEGYYLVKIIRNGDCIVELVQPPYKIERGDGYWDHIALKVRDIDGVIEILKRKGIEFEEGTYTIAPHVFPNGSKWVMFRGPDNEHIELNERL